MIAEDGAGVRLLMVAVSSSEVEARVPGNGGVASDVPFDEDDDQVSPMIARAMTLLAERNHTEALAAEGLTARKSDGVMVVRATDIAHARTNRDNAGDHSDA